MAEHARRSRRFTLLALLVAGSLVPLSSSASGSTELWSGYRITPTGTADGGFIGSRKVDRRVAYRIDPRARRTTERYSAVDVKDPHTRAQARAAWILAKYGDERIADQAAAVDVATYALLAGVRVGGPRAVRRTNATGHGATIRTLARTMLASSRDQAGPYRVVVRPTGAVVGGHVRVLVRVLSRRGVRMASVPVTIRYAAKDPRLLETDTRGEAVAHFRAGQSGFQTVRAVARRLPDWRLLMRRPKRSDASRIVLAGHRTHRAVRAKVAVQARPTLAVTAIAPVADGRLPIGSTFEIESGEPTIRPANVWLHGPFGDEASAGCDPAQGVPLGQVPVGGDGTYATPKRLVTTAGFYLWRVEVAGDALNTPATACGGLTRVRTMPTLRVAAYSSTAAVGARIRAKATVGNIPWGYDGSVTFSLYGPYVDRAHATCYSGKRVAQVQTVVPLSGTYASPRVQVARAGVYAWRAVLPAGYFNLRALTPCGASGTFVKVG